MAVGAGGAFTGGVNRLPPVGLIDFSVGAGGGGGGGGVAGDVVVVVVVVVVVSGASGSSWAHDAVNPTIVTIAAPPATAAIRRPIRPMIFVLTSKTCASYSRSVWRDGTLIQCLDGRTVIAQQALEEGDIFRCAVA
jgi:hypothetical protein